MERRCLRCRWWKAQAIAESGLDSTARSYCGAQGLMQIIPGTWVGIAPKLGVTSPWLVKDNIQAGIYYDARMWAIWKAPRPLEERIAFTLASYNAGPGHIIKAQRLVAVGKSPNKWAMVAVELHRVTGRSATETRGYIARTGDAILALPCTRRYRVIVISHQIKLIGFVDIFSGDAFLLSFSKLRDILSTVRQTQLR